MKRRYGMISLLLALLVIAQGVEAEAKKSTSREKEALRRTQMQLQQVQSQVSSLEQEKAKLARDLDKSAKATKVVQARARRLEQELAESKRLGEAQTKELEQVRQELAAGVQRLAEARRTSAETNDRLTESTRQLRQTEAEKKVLEGLKARNEREIATCEAHNGKLYQVGRELMGRYANKTCAETMAQAEPFTGLRKVEVENLLETYRDKLDEQKLLKLPVH